MNSAIFFSGQFGSTAQYAQWMGEATSLPVYDINQPHPNPSEFKFLILGSSVIIGKLTIRSWVKNHLAHIINKPVVLFSVAGAPPGPEVDTWVAKSLPEALTSKMQHVALRGKLDINKVGWWTRFVLKIGAWVTKDPQTKKEMTRGFDFMDKASIEPVVKIIENLKSDIPINADQAVPC